MSKNGVLTLLGPGYCDDYESTQAVHAIDKHIKKLGSASIFVGNGRSERVRNNDIKGSISHMLENFDAPSLLFMAHGRRALDAQEGVKLKYTNFGVTSSEILKFIKEEARSGQTVDCAFLSCFGGASFSGLNLLPRKSKLIALASNRQYFWTSDLEKFASAVERTEGEFSLNNAFIEYINSGEKHKSMPAIGISMQEFVRVASRRVHRPNGLINRAGVSAGI